MTQIIKFKTAPTILLAQGQSVRVSIPVPEPGKKPVAAAPREPVGLAVTFQNEGRTCPFTPGQSVCEIAERNRVNISAECHRGICGSDPIQVVTGQDTLNLMTDDERSTLKEVCGLDQARYRLACLTRPTGPVVVSLKVFD